MKKKYRIQIKGMNCASCVNKIESSLQKMTGIDSISVNLSSEMGEIIFEDRLLQEGDISRAIHQLGFKTLPFPRGPIEKRSEEFEKSEEKKEKIV